MPSVRRIAAPVLLAAAASPLAAQTTSFHGIEACRVSYVGCSTVSSGISADGSTLVGIREGVFIDVPRALLWSQTAGLIDMGPLIHGLGFARASAASADGSVVVGTTYPTPQSGGFFRTAAWRWVGGVATDLGALGGGMFSEAHSVSADGSIVVGASMNPAATEAFRWTQAGGMVGLGALGGTDPAFRSAAFGISGNGQVIVGESDSAPGRQAFRWTQAGGMTGLGNLAGGAPGSKALAASFDGSVIVGQGTGARGPEAFRWTGAAGMLGLGHLAGGANSIARAVSASGAVVVGDSDSTRGMQAFVWTEASGMRGIADGLIAAGVNLTGWNLTSATGVSADGTVIVGSGTGPSSAAGQISQAWIARSGAGSIPPGLTTPVSLVQSVASMSATPLSGERAARADSRRVLSVARQEGGGSPQPVRTASLVDVGMSVEAPTRWEAYVLGSGQWWNYDPQTQGNAPGLSAGLSYQATPEWRFGGGLSAEKVRDDTIFDGRYRTDGIGAHAFASWRSRSGGWRALALANYLALEADIRRGYVNGAGTATSSGSTDGCSYGVLARLEYEFAIGTRTTLAPYADYGWARTRLDAYAENPASGPFPASFDRQRYDSEVARVGVEIAHRVGRASTVYGWLAYADRTNGDSASVSGRFVGLGGFSLDNLRVPDSDWVEAGAGFSHPLGAQVRLIGSFGMLYADSRTTSAFATLGVGFGF